MTTIILKKYFLLKEIFWLRVKLKPFKLKLFYYINGTYMLEQFNSILFDGIQATRASTSSYRIINFYCNKYIEKYFYCPTPPHALTSLLSQLKFPLSITIISSLYTFLYLSSFPLSPIHFPGNMETLLKASSPSN